MKIRCTKCGERYDHRLNAIDAGEQTTEIATTNTSGSTCENTVSVSDDMVDVGVRVFRSVKPTIDHEDLVEQIYLAMEAAREKG